VPVYQTRATDPGRERRPTLIEPTDSMALRDAIALTLMNSPDLAAFAWETRAREARVVQAGRPPNPTLGWLSEDLGAKRMSGAEAQQPIQLQTTLQVSQLVELGGKRSARLHMAVRDRELAEWSFEAARMDALTGVTHAFIDVLVAQEMVALTRQTSELVAQVEQSVGARVVAGVVSPIEQTRAQVSRAAARVEAERAVRQLTSSRERLITFWGGARATFPGVKGTLDVVPNLPTLESLRTRLSQTPALARWAAEISRRQAALAAEQAKRVPDLSLIGGYRRFTDLDNSAYLIGASLSLPLFDRNSGAVDEAKSLVSKAYEERRAAEGRVNAALSDAFRALSSAQQEAVALRETMLPGSRQTFELVTEGYRLGRFAYLDVLDAQRTLIAAEGQYLRALSDYHKAVANVERLIGAPLDSSTQ